MNPIESIYKNKIVAVIRAENASEAIEKAKAMADGGIKVFEITVENRGLVSAINELKNIPDITVMAGNVITSMQAQEAIDNGYQIFGLDHVTASVSVTGNRMIVGSLTKSDIQIKAQQTSSITTAGTYTLPLAASKTGVKSDYEFSSAVSPSTIVVNVDRYQEKTLDITSEIVYKVDSGYYSRSVLHRHSLSHRKTI